MCLFGSSQNYLFVDRLRRCATLDSPWPHFWRQATSMRHFGSSQNSRLSTGYVNAPFWIFPKFTFNDRLRRCATSGPPEFTSCFNWFPMNWSQIRDVLCALLQIGLRSFMFCVYFYILISNPSCFTYVPIDWSQTLYVLRLVSNPVCWAGGRQPAGVKVL